MSKVKVKNLNTQYSELIVVKPNGTISKHIVSNNGYRPLAFWIKKFEGV